MTEDPKSTGLENTDRELWREREGDYYADSIFVTKAGAIGINCGGTVHVAPLRAWFNAINGVPRRREGERGDVAADVAAVDKGMSFVASAGWGGSTESERKIALGAWKRLRAALVAATPPAPPPAVGVEGEDERPKIDWHFCANGRKWRSYSSVFCSMCCGHYGSHRLTDADIPDPNVPPVVGVPVQVVERLLKRAIEDDGGWHIHDADLAWFKEHYESAKQGKVYVDTWPSRGVPVEVCERIAPALREAHKKHPQGLVILGAAKFCQAGGVNVDLTPAGTWEFLSGIEAARRGEGAAGESSKLREIARTIDNECDDWTEPDHTQMIRGLVQTSEAVGEMAKRLGRDPEGCGRDTIDAALTEINRLESDRDELRQQLAATQAEVERLKDEVQRWKNSAGAEGELRELLSAAQAEVERLESLVYKRMENEQLNLACRFRLGHMAGVPQGEVGGHSDMNLVEMVYQKLLAASGGNSVGE